MIVEPVVEETEAAALEKIKSVNRRADGIELRLDAIPLLDDFSLLFDESKKPVIAAVRSRRQGGFYPFSEVKRIELQKKILNNKPDYIEVEYRSPRSFRNTLIKKAGKSSVILSYEDPSRTPYSSILKMIYNEMKLVKGVDIIRIATHANSPMDSIKMSALAKQAKIDKRKLVAYCTGQNARLSRVTALLEGAPFTYSSPRKDEGMDIEQLKRQLEIIGYIESKPS